MQHPHGTPEEQHEHTPDHDVATHDEHGHDHGHGHGHHPQGLRGRGGFIISGLTGGHGVFHWFTQSFLAMLPEVQAAYGLSGIGVGGITSVRELVSGVVTLPRRHYRRCAPAALGAGACAVHGVLRDRLADSRYSAELLPVACRHGRSRARGVHLALAGDGVLVSPLLASQRRGAVFPRCWWADWRCACAARNGLAARLLGLARHNQHLRRCADIPRIPRLLGIQEHRQDGARVTAKIEASCQRQVACFAIQSCGLSRLLAASAEWRSSV